jgi:hypothetical protein
MPLYPLLASSPDPVAIMLAIPAPIVVPIVACLAFVWNATAGRRIGGVLASFIATGLAAVYLIMLVQYGAGREEKVLYGAGFFSIVVGAGSALLWRRRK